MACSRNLGRPKIKNRSGARTLLARVQHRIRQCADAFDADLDAVAVRQEHRRFARETDAGRGAGQDHGAREEGWCRGLRNAISSATL